MEDLVKNCKKSTKSSVIFWYLGFFFVTLRHRIKQQIMKTIKNNNSKGVNPLDIDTWRKNCRVKLTSIGGIITMLVEGRGRKEDVGNIPGELNFNPYVTDPSTGEKKYYQRPYCWTLEDEQMFIESIYNELDCGKIVLRTNVISDVLDAFTNGDKEVCYYDVVDGKQRLHTLYRFINDEFPDSHGNYYSDFSDVAKRMFKSRSCITLMEMDEGCTDEDVLKVFLNVNFSGKPMSKEHIKFVQGIYNNFNNK